MVQPHRLAHGVEVPAPRRTDLQTGAYATGFDPALMQLLHARAGHGGLLPRVARRFMLEQLPRAFDAVTGHHLGRIALVTQ